MTMRLTHLLFKELRQLAPILVLWSVVLLIGYISQLATIRLDQHSFSAWCGEFCSAGLNAESMFFVVVTAIFCVVTAYSLFPREHDDATIDFLNALPVSRATIFVAKCLAAWLAVSAISSLSYVLDYGLLTLNSQSIDGKAYPGVMATQALRDALFAYVVVAHGVFLSRFRTPGLIVYALYFLGLIWWENSRGSAGAFNIFAFYSNEFVGEKLLLNWSTIVPHLIAATVIYIAAFRLWHRAESRVVQRLNEQRQIGWLGMVFSVLAFLLISSVMAGRFVADSVMGDREAVATDQYNFIFVANSQKTVDSLVEHADEDFQALAGLLNTEEKPEIVVDLTAQKGHVAGLAVWKKIQMDISDGQTDSNYRRILSHETAHVFQSVLTERKLARDTNATLFFTEGMAQLTSFRIVPDPAMKRKNQVVAALAWKRHDIRFRDLSNYSNFERRFDAELVYSLAETWVEALVQTCGDRILGDVLRSAGRDGVPPGLPGEVYWRQILQHVNCELETVNVNWFSSMDSSMGNGLPDGEDPYPEFGALTFRQSEASSVTVTADVVESDPQMSTADNESFVQSLDYYLRVQPGDVLLKGISPVYRGDVQTNGNRLQVVFHVPASQASNGRIRYQIGFRPEKGARIFFERWRRAVVQSE